MPQVFIIAAMGAAALAGYKLVRREMRRVEQALRETAPEPVKAPVERGTLERGTDGVYRPRG
jgi:hypothetical protein